MLNTLGSVDVPLSLFSSLDTELSPSDIPEGISPDNQDIVYTPGTVSTRPGFQRVFTANLDGGEIVYQKSFVLPNKTVKNLYLTSLGNMWVEDITNSPGTATLLFTTLATAAQSVTCDGVEYIGLSDGVHGFDVPVQYDGTVVNRVTQDGPGAPPTVQSFVGGVLPLVTSGNTFSRMNNVVTVNVTSDGILQVGYQVQVSGIPATVIGGAISSIVINNEDNPGIATVTTSGAHGLAPGNSVSITGVAASAVGGAITAAVRKGQIVTITTTTPHGLTAGGVVTIAGVTDTTFDGSWVISTVVDSMNFSYVDIDADATSSGGTVSINWPIPDTPTPTYFQVISAPTATTFQVALNYGDGSWTGGLVSFGWDGIFYVTSINSLGTSFTYQQYGPDANTTANGVVALNGQISPGIHQCQVAFITEQDAITEPSPPTTFVANGGQYLIVTNIPIGPANTKGRVLLFTGAGGDFFFYIPVQAQVNGQIVSTATQINDNITTNFIVDFSDSTLFQALGTSVPGNNLQAQNVLGPSAAFWTYSSRLIAWGGYNKVQNLLNMGFDGGYIGSLAAPTGWTVTGTGTLAAARFNGFNWKFTGVGNITQPFFEDAYGDPIAEANTLYSVRAYLTGTYTFRIELVSSNTGFVSNATIAVNGAGWYTATLSLPTPASIPSDLTLFIENLFGTGTVDEISIIFAEQPFTDTSANFSYEDNFEGFDGETGIAGPEDDQTAVRNWGVIRDTLYCVTGGSLHETNDNGTTEPSGWGFRHVADNCGAWSISSVARNVQGIGSAGKEWMVWGGPDGAQIFVGQQPVKISQEIESLWQDIDQNRVSSFWTTNDEVAKRCYFGVPIPGPNKHILVLDYRNMAGGEGIGSEPPIRISFSGKMIASDLTRKWTKWTPNAPYGQLLFRPGLVAPVMTFSNGAGGSNIHVLNPQKFTDDDYGIIPSYYTTYFFVSHDMEQALQVGSHRKLYQFITAYIEGVGFYNITPLGAALDKPFPATPNQVLTQDQAFDLEAGLNVETSRCAFKIQVFPLMGQTDAFFSLQKLVVNMRVSPWSKVRGTNTGTY